MNPDSNASEIYPPFEKWFASLDSDTRAKAERMISRMKELGAEDAEGWVRSEIEGGIPQMARYIFLRRVWSEINGWEADLGSMYERVHAEGERNPEGYFAKASGAMERMRAAGVSLEDVSCITKMAAYEAMFGLIQVIDDGGDPDAGDDLPGWALIEIGPDGEDTGRNVDALHESILEVLPAEEERKYL